MNQIDISCTHCSISIKYPKDRQQQNFVCPGCGRALQFADSSANAGFSEWQISGSGLSTAQQPEQTNGLGLVLAMILASLVTALAVIFWFVKSSELPDTSALVREIPTKTFLSTESGHVTEVEIGQSIQPPAEYKWQINDAHEYRFQIWSGEDHAELQYSGGWRFTVGKTGADPRSRQIRQGTAFVVSSDGYIVTSLRLVIHAEIINAYFSDKRYKAHLVARNPDTNLALLKVAAKDLSVSQLARNESAKNASVQLIAAEHTRQKPLQINATNADILEPLVKASGRSLVRTNVIAEPLGYGGPLVDEFGAVVGVAIGDDYSQPDKPQGLAATITNVKSLLRACEVPFQHCENSEAVSLPNIVEQLKPTVVAVSALGVKGVTHQLQSVVSVDKAATTLWGSQDRTVSNTMAVTSFGQVAQEKSPTWLPYALGSVEQFFLTELDRDHRQQWEVIRPRSISVPSHSSSRLQIPILSPSNSQALSTASLAQERIQYTISKQLESGNVEVTKIYELQTTTAAAPSLKITGSEQIEFDSTIGMPVNGEFVGEVIHGFGDKFTSIPVKVMYHRRTKEELQLAKDRAKQRRDEIREKKLHELTVPDPDRVRLILEELTSARSTTSKLFALRKLRGLAAVEELRADILKQCDLHQNVSSDSLSGAATEVLAWYSTEDDIEELLRIATSRARRDSDARYIAATKLIEFGETEFLAEIVTLATDPFESRTAGQIFRKAGPLGEQLLLEGLDRNLSDIECSRLINILEDVGTEKSLERLSKIKYSGFSKSAALVAIGAIKRRLEK